MSAVQRSNVRVRGDGDRVMVFAHGFGCDQAMWRHVAPSFETDFRTLLFDNVGAGGSDLKAYNPVKYASLVGYADDLIEILRELDLSQVVFVGHSVSSMIGVLASIRAPDLFSQLILVGPSPRYIDDGDYVGGFAADQIEELLAFLAESPMAWSEAMAPAIMGNADRPELGEELTESFCRVDPVIAEAFARTTFTSDNRADLPLVTTPALILQCRDDIIAPEAVGRHVHASIPGSTFVMLDATGHCPNLSAPAEVIAAIRAFV
ncbi:alpha/beta hydrolase [Brevundimonas sp. NIBR11]|uniref:alpha/beta fold hydrolase n=1 Tax=Brevundimonas sp. NIBR11 TaxID=3015999 RepID=UPI0022F08ED9|nr:alpha/beta hydrolase [Brevundimonas sp. NIBR11]WGM30593.1 Sigma factor SigB regulation protein RsbQ [Brevundimonas sp. NIBR11]